MADDCLTIEISCSDKRFSSEDIFRTSLSKCVMSGRSEEKILSEDISDTLVGGGGGGTVVTVVTVEVVATDVTVAVTLFLRGGTDFPFHSDRAFHCLGERS